MSDNVLFIFIKYPEPGLVKTRLAKDIGNYKAAELYKIFVEEILKETKCKDFSRVVFYDPPDKKQDILDWIGGGIELCHQVKGDLGVRLSNAFQSIFKNGAKRVVVIGSDSPTIDVRVIKKAFIELKTKDCVIGPSKDGGYYLLGLSSYHKEIFQGISWSTDKVFKETLDRLNASGLSLSTLEEGFDIDTVEDLELIKDRFPI